MMPFSLQTNVNIQTGLVMMSESVLVMVMRHEQTWHQYKHSRYEVFGRSRYGDGIRVFVAVVSYSLVCFLDIIGLERWLSHKQRIHNHTQRPYIHLKAMAASNAVQDLRSNIVLLKSAKVMGMEMGIDVVMVMASQVYHIWSCHKKTPIKI